MIFVELLHANRNRVDPLYSSMTRRKACCAGSVMLVKTKKNTHTAMTDQKEKYDNN